VAPVVAEVDVDLIALLDHLRDEGDPIARIPEVYTAKRLLLSLN